MKNIFIIVLFLACGNPKEEIVEQIKTYEDSIKLTEIKIKYLPIEEVQKGNFTLQLIRYRSIVDSLNWELKKY